MVDFGHVKSGVAAIVAVLLMGCGDFDRGAFDDPATVGVSRSALTTTANQSLLITDISVTRDAARTKDPCSAVPGDENRVWTIGHMLKREAEKNGISPSTYVANWISAWTGTVTINGQTVPPLLGPAVRDDWQRFAGGSTALPLHKAPFWLLAIASRLDLRKHRPLGEPLGGEVRFVFGMLQAGTNNPACPTTAHAQLSTVILEYSPAKTDENQVQDFGRRWLALASMTGSTYRSALQNLTEEVINNGRLLRIRTNEGIDLGRVGGTARWHLGEFTPNATTKFLQRSTIKQAPTMALATNDSQLLSNWIWSNRGDLVANAFDLEFESAGSGAVTAFPIGSYSVPNQFPGTTTWFRGSLNDTNNNNTEDFFSGPFPQGMTEGQLLEWSDARFRFSVGTCRGCHGADAAGSSQIMPQSGPGTQAGRSPFLNGPVTIDDPTGLGFPRTLDEMSRRENDLRNLVNGAAVTGPVFGNNYKVRFANGGKCLDSAGNTTTEGAFSQLFTCHGNGNQRLSLVSAGSFLYNLKYKHSNKCIDVQNASTSSGARVVQTTCNSSRPSQKLEFSVVTGTPERRVLKFQHSNLCLLVENQGTADGTRIVQATCPTYSEGGKGFDLVE